jgi:hypothetical protein
MTIFDLSPLTHLFPLPETGNFLIEQLTPGLTLFAKVSRDIDVLAQMQDAFNNFIKSGQVWALGIGFVLGYLFRSLTAG